MEENSQQPASQARISPKTSTPHQENLSRMRSHAMVDSTPQGGAALVTLTAIREWTELCHQFTDEE